MLPTLFTASFQRTAASRVPALAYMNYEDFQRLSNDELASLATNQSCASICSFIFTCDTLFLSVFVSLHVRFDLLSAFDVIREKSRFIIYLIAETLFCILWIISVSDDVGLNSLLQF